VLWRDFSSRSVHEQAMKTKALATLFYGHAPKFTYWDGSSMGGRQALNLAQRNPNDYDGILANLPAIYFTHMAAAGLYPQIVYQHDLGGKPLSEGQLDLVSNAAINACDVVGGQHMGYILDPGACRYDPTKDKAVLCNSAGGTNATTDCFTKVQANVVNKIWYGPTSDGSVPSPSTDNGWQKDPLGVRKWFGLPRGTSLYDQHYSTLAHTNAGWANPGGPAPISVDTVALMLEEPAIATPAFHNAKSNGMDKWKTLTYAELTAAIQRGEAMQAQFDYLDTDNPDLSAFKAHGGKMLAWQGLNDEMIPVQGTIHYYRSVIAQMGGLAKVQDFYRFYLVPGNGHGPYNGTSNKDAHPPALAGHQLYDRLVDWVENGNAPESIEITAGLDSPVKRTAPLCAYPQMIRYVSGDPNLASSFICR
jgi:feruloyl esterase